MSDKNESTFVDGLTQAVKDNIVELLILYGLKGGDVKKLPTSKELDFVVRIAKEVTREKPNGDDGEGFVQDFYKMFSELTGEKEASTLAEAAMAYYRKKKLILYFMTEYNAQEKVEPKNNIAIITMIDMVEKYRMEDGINIVRAEFERSGNLSAHAGPHDPAELKALNEIIEDHFKTEGRGINSFFIVIFYCIGLSLFLIICAEKATTLTENGTLTSFWQVIKIHWLTAIAFTITGALILARFFALSLRKLFRNISTLWRNT